MKSFECGQSGNVAAYVADELSLPERGTFEGHLAGCEACRLAVEESRRVVYLLTSVPVEPVTRDLAPGVMARVNEPPRGWATLVWRGLAAAAGLAVLLGGLWWHQRHGVVESPVLAGQEGEPAPVEAATEWLCATQEADGSWSTARWGGRAQFEVALTGLSLMALLETEAPSGRVQAAVMRAVDYLVGRQDEAGRFGPVFDGEPYNQGIATLALVRALELHPTDSLRGVVGRAVQRIEEKQHADGGWGYENTADASSNLSISLWQVEALRLAGRLGWKPAEASAGRGLRWMTRMVAEDGAFGYRQKGDFPEGSQTLTAMGAMSLFDGVQGGLISPERAGAIRRQVCKMAADGGPDMDYYRRYFLAAALRKMGEDTETGMLVSVRRELVARQVGAGSERGSWPADDRWSSAGGRVYATALAALSLK